MRRILTAAVLGVLVLAAGGAGTATGASSTPAERTIHADLILERAHRLTLSRTVWVGFPVPSHWRQAYGEGPERLPGVVERTVDLPRGGECTVLLGLGARLTAVPPLEHDGQLFPNPREEAEIGGIPIASRTQDATGTTTWLGRPGRTGASGVRAGRAPAGLGPAGLGTLTLEGFVDAELDRFGPPGPDGYPPLDPTKGQKDACSRLAADAIRRLLPRVLAGAEPTSRPRPPRPDPNDEAPIDLEPAH